MIDTISIRMSHPVPARNQPPGWEFEGDDERWISVGGDRRPQAGRIRARCLTTNARLWGRDGHYERLEVSLPRMVNGTNNELLLTDDALQSAIAHTRRHAAEVLGQDVEGEVVRVDLCHQFSGVASRWITALRHTKHPLIRKLASFVSMETLYLKGSETELCVYDKGAEAGLARDAVVRVEWKIKTARAVKARFGQSLSISAITYPDCYRVYRSLCFGLSPAPTRMETTKCNVPDILVLADQRGYHHFVDEVLGAMKPHTRRRTNQRMKLRQHEIGGLDFHRLLGPTGPSSYGSFAG